MVKIALILDFFKLFWDLTKEDMSKAVADFYRFGKWSLEEVMLSNLGIIL